MRLLLKSVLSVAAWLVVTLVVAAVIELSFGEPRPGFVPLLTLVVMVPILLRIWRSRTSASQR